MAEQKIYLKKKAIRNKIHHGHMSMCLNKGGKK